MSKKTDYVMEQERLPVGPTCCEGGNLGEPHECRKQQVAVVEQPGAIQRAPTLIDVFSALARDTSIDVSRLKQLMELQERAEARHAEREFITAMNRLQQKLPRISKKGKIEFTSKNTGVTQSTPYAKYEDVMEVIGPLMLAEGFTVSYGTQPIEKAGGIVITATLAHAAGHSRTESMPLPFDTSGSKNSIQAVGSSMSYGKRYLLFAMLNLVTEGQDDDALAAGMQFIEEQQVNNIIDMFSACDMDQKSQSKFLEILKAETVSEIHKRDYAEAMNLLNKKLRKRQEAL